MMLVSLKEIIDKYALELLVYFGSYQTEEYDPWESDIDIA